MQWERIAYSNTYTRELVHEQYEISNHLVNCPSPKPSPKRCFRDSYPARNERGVLVVVSDVKTNVHNGGVITGYAAQVFSAADYSPFGVVLEGRTYASGNYRFGFQAQEQDKELWEDAVTYKYRVKDPRLGRFFRVDPLFREYPHNSVYAFSENRVLDAIELEGLEAYFIHGTVKACGVDYTGEVNSAQFDKENLKEVEKMFGNNSINHEFNWEGLNTDECRQKSGNDLAQHILSTRTCDEAIALIGHNHGGNVAIHVANILISEHGIPAEQFKIIALNKPAEDDIKLLHDGVDMFAVSCHHDVVQQGGSDHWVDVVVSKADASIWYEDHYDWDCLDHYGVGDKNVKVWLPELDSVIKKHNKPKEAIDIDNIEIDIQEKHKTIPLLNMVRKINNQFIFYTIKLPLQYVFYFLVLFQCSCSGPCQPFDFGRIDMSEVQFYDMYSYTNGVDSLVLNQWHKYYTTANKGYLGVCEPRFEISFGVSINRPALIYTFRYLREGNKYSDTKMSFNIFDGRIDLNSDSIKLATYGELFLQDFEHMGKLDSTKYIKNAKLQNMVLIEFETMDGKIWRLYEVGNKIQIDSPNTTN